MKEQPAQNDKTRNMQQQNRPISKENNLHVNLLKSIWAIYEIRAVLRPGALVWWSKCQSAGSEQQLLWFQTSTWLEKQDKGSFSTLEHNHDLFLTSTDLQNSLNRTTHGLQDMNAGLWAWLGLLWRTPPRDRIFPAHAAFWRWWRAAASLCVLSPACHPWGSQRLALPPVWLW